MLEDLIDKGLSPTVDTDYERWQPLHWFLTVPDVIDGGGFDAICRQPALPRRPKTHRGHGNRRAHWLVNVLAGGTRGSADLAAYVFLGAQVFSIAAGHSD